MTMQEIPILLAIRSRLARRPGHLLIKWVTEAPSPRVSGLSMKLTTNIHLHVMLGSQIVRSITSTFSYISMAWPFGTGCDKVQAVSRRLPTAVTQVRSCWIYGVQSGNQAGFLRIIQFPLPILIPPTSARSLIILSSRYWQRRLVTNSRFGPETALPSSFCNFNYVPKFEEFIVFWDVTLCSIVETYRRNRRAYCPPHLQGRRASEGQVHTP
jgi:hypothetical protein